MEVKTIFADSKVEMDIILKHYQEIGRTFPCVSDEGYTYDDLVQKYMRPIYMKLETHDRNQDKET